MSNATCLITGASSGIGRAFAIELARRGCSNLVVVARREDRLTELKKEIETLNSRIKVFVYPGDLTKQSFRKELVDWLAAQQLFVSLLINNAGFGFTGSFITGDPDKQRQMVRLNCEAPMDLARLLLPAMIESRSGAIINVCSTAAKQPMPFMATYAATKAFLVSFSLALYREARPYGVHVMAHCPGPTESEFHLVAGLKEKISILPVMSAQKVVREALEGARRRRPVLINGRVNRLVAALGSILPDPWAAALVERILAGTERAAN